MEDTHTTVVVERDKWIEIITLHDQSGSAAIGLVPIENIPMLIEGLKKFIKPIVISSVCEHKYQDNVCDWKGVRKCIICGEMEKAN